MISKKIINKIMLLEETYKIEYFNIEEHTQRIINMLENALGHKLTINLSCDKYFDKRTLEIDIYKQLSIEDLRTLAYGKEIKK